MVHGASALSGWLAMSTASACPLMVLLWVQVGEAMPEWLPSAILMDNSKAELAATKQAFKGSMPILLCHRHAQRSWEQCYTKVRVDVLACSAARLPTCTFTAPGLLQASKQNVETMCGDMLELMRFNTETTYTLKAAEALILAREQLAMFGVKWVAERRLMETFTKGWGVKIGEHLS